MKKNLLSLFVSVVALSTSLLAQVPLTPLQRCNFERVTTHEELVQYLQDLAKASPRIVTEKIGTTVQGRDIPMVHVVPVGSGKKIKVLLFCQQHGNEPSGKEAALQLLENIAEGVGGTWSANLDLFIIPSVNPDGNESGKRANANKEDLNRDHLLLSQPEVRAVHAAFTRVQPEVALDVHEFSAYRKEFLAAGYVRAVDEQFGAPTNVNVPSAIRKYGLEQLFPSIESDLAKQHIRFANYLKMDEPSDTVRPSTTAIDDGRQSFAILNTFSFILEGKNGRSMNDELQRRSNGQYAAIKAFLAFVNQRSAEIRSLILAEREKNDSPSDSVAVRMDYVYAGATINLPMIVVATAADTTVAMKSAPDVKVIESVSRPFAYVIPGTQTAVVDFLQRHEIRYETVTKPMQRKVETYLIKDVVSIWMENKSFLKIAVETSTKLQEIQPGDLIVPLHQPASAMLVTALEPTSMWGIVQLDEFAALRMKGSEYPIRRIMK